MMSHSMPGIEIQEEILLEEDIVGTWSIVLYNDEVNTFDWVIECLVKYCGHLKLQAEQCAWFVHTKGKYAVKNGGLEELSGICCDKGLSAKLEN
jgi:ATP-dependent Clp protease adaptor protein ClpS